MSYSTDGNTDVSLGDTSVSTPVLGREITTSGPTPTPIYLFQIYQVALNHDTTTERIGFEADGETLRVRDALEGEALLLRTDRELDPQPALTELFPFPVDRAISFETGSISIPAYSAVLVRDEHGEFVAQLDEAMELPRGSYCFGVSGVMKALIRVTDVEVDATGMAGSGPVELTFDRPRTVSVGARSLHTEPEATITVPDDPAALAEAVSVLGSSIKEFSPERSWPTLRGYPPRIQRDERPRDDRPRRRLPEPVGRSARRHRPVVERRQRDARGRLHRRDRKSTRLNSSH